MLHAWWSEKLNGKTIRLFTDCPLEEGVDYVIDADGICAMGFCGTYLCTDSELEFSFTGLPELPDLAVARLAAEFQIYAMCAPYEFSFNIANYGYAPAGPFKVHISIQNGTVIPLDSLTYTGLEVGEELTEVLRCRAIEIACNRWMPLRPAPTSSGSKR